tara:strand:+ start:99 stop:854 length:756 start_codon:yes stop_codon:yes gene_type:complete
MINKVSSRAKNVSENVSKNVSIANETIDNNKNAYIYEDNNSDTLIISFAGNGFPGGKYPIFTFYNFLQEYNVDKLFVRDLKTKYYLTSLLNTTTDLYSTIDMLKNIINSKHYKKKIAIGCSSGAYAAILFGHLLQCDHVIAFNPQTVLNNDKFDIINDNIINVTTCKYLTNYSNDIFFQKCLDLKSFIPFYPQIQIHYSKYANKGIDKKYAEHIKSDKCILHEYNSNSHLLAQELKANNQLHIIINNVINL